MYIWIYIYFKPARNNTLSPLWAVVTIPGAFFLFRDICIRLIIFFPLGFISQSEPNRKIMEKRKHEHETMIIINGMVTNRSSQNLKRNESSFPAYCLTQNRQKIK